MIDLAQVFTGMSLSGARATWTLPASLPYFDGHFPGNPIFPAVGIVDASLHALGLHLGRAVTLEAVQSAKFTQVVGPDQPVEITLEPSGARWIVNWTLAKDAQPVATLTLSLREDA